MRRQSTPRIFPWTSPRGWRPWQTTRTSRPTGGVFFESPEQMAAFLALQESFVAPIISADPDKRRALRPLLDLFNKVQRAM
mmetsp:Transcript_40763/g.103798  ORF Transcript_40763/g.103798 Transcript_40763/m.103798 type:complete len:81 (+) Transcript_40763:731-973(+)